MTSDFAVPGPKRKLQSRYFAFTGIAAAALVLGVIATITVRTLLSTSDRLDSVAASRGVSSAYAQVELSIGQAAVHSTRFRDSGDLGERAQILQWIGRALEAEQQIKVLGDDDDRAFLAFLEGRYGSQLADGLAIMAGADPASPAFDGDNETQVLDNIVTALADPASKAQASTDQELLGLRDSFSDNSTTILSAIALAVPLLGLLFVLVSRYERKDAIQASELERLSQAALTDGLTGLGNHRAFQEELRREVARSARNASPISIVMIDVDDFKEINDTLGHAHGDSVLANVGRLMAFMRSADRAFRVGGDEFALIMPDTPGPAAFEALQRLRKSVPEAIEGVTISIGVCTSVDGADNATQLRDEADSALYEAKHRGKNLVVAYDSSLDLSSELAATKMQSLREVLANRDVSMWFQPIFRFGSEQLLAFEALLRLPNYPGLTGPEDAFVVAQHMGRAHDLDLLCVEKALRSARDLPDEAKIFINLDPSSLMHAEFSPEALARLVEDAGVDRANVVFEVTEKTDAPLQRLVKQVGAIRELGFAMALDDVGAGNSGLEMLRLAHFDYVKIDRSVVLDAMDGGPGRAIILAIVAFARETGAFMIAEGIETPEMLEAVKLDADGLKRFWIQGVQGFLFGEPRPNLEPFVRARGASAA